MPAFAFTGGSFGDILAMAQLAWQISRTLEDLTGASGSLTMLIADIRMFARTLHELKDALEHRRVVIPGLQTQRSRWIAGTRSCRPAIVNDPARRTGSGCAAPLLGCGFLGSAWEQEPEAVTQPSEASFARFPNSTTLCASTASGATCARLVTDHTSPIVG
ncbi:hypothetical protein AURDEDRAFT_170261 [Auricularia subglabra TFB-10046 SS5]|nr:hypothetical protein AURDEDRAFT_170261 [Auricularia subglabra TFB-10046 SS5]